MKGIKITAMLLIICQTVMAQQKTAEEVTKNRMDRLESMIELSEDQKSSIETIVLESSQKIIELKQAGSVDKEEIVALKKEERSAIKTVLSESQLTTLKEAKKVMKADRKEAKAERVKRKEARSALVLKRQEFEGKLTLEEKDAIDKARALVPARTKGEKLTEEQKAERKWTRKEVHKLLKPVMDNHKADLEKIHSEMPLPAPKKQNQVKDEKKKSKRFMHRFLLMK
ncbi:MAG: hypothetical protein ACPGTP_10035 [Bacteroidia bacterium]